MSRWIFGAALMLSVIAGPALAQTCGFPDRIGILTDTEAKEVEVQLNRALSDGGFGRRATGTPVLRLIKFDLPGAIDIQDKRHIGPVGDTVIIEQIMGISTDCRVTNAFTRNVAQNQKVTEPYNLLVERQVDGGGFEEIGVFRQGMSGGFPSTGLFRLTVQPIGILSPFNIKATPRLISVTTAAQQVAAAPPPPGVCGFPDRIGIISDAEKRQVEAQLNRALSDGGFSGRATGQPVLKQMFFDLPTQLDLSDKRHIGPVGDYVRITKIMGISTACRVISAFTENVSKKTKVTQPYNLRVERQANKDAPFEELGVFRQGMSGGFPSPGIYRLTVEPIGVISPFSLVPPTRIVTVSSPGQTRTVGILQIQIKNPPASKVVGTAFVIGAKVPSSDRTRAHCKPVTFDAHVKVGEIISETNTNVFSRNTRVQRYGAAHWELHKNGQVIERIGPQGGFRFDPLVYGDGSFHLFAALDEADQGQGPSAFRPKPTRHVVQVFRCGPGDQDAIAANAEQAEADAAAGARPQIKVGVGEIATIDVEQPGGRPQQKAPPQNEQEKAEAKAAVEQEFEEEIEELEGDVGALNEELEVAALDENNEIVKEEVLDSSRFLGEPPLPPRDDIVVPESCAECEREIARHRRLLRKSCKPAVEQMLGFFQDIAKFDAVERAIEADHFLSVLEPLKNFREPQVRAAARFASVIEFAARDMNALQTQSAQLLFANAQREALALDVERRAKRPDALFIPPMIGGLIDRRFASEIFAFDEDIFKMLSAKAAFDVSVREFNETQGGDFRARVERHINENLKDYNARFLERLIELLNIREAFEDRRTRVAQMFRSGEFEHCLGGPKGDDRALKAVPGMTFVLPDPPDRGVDIEVFRAAAILPPVFDIPVAGFEEFFPVRFKLDGDERLAFELDLRQRIEAIEGLDTLVAIESGATLLGDFLLAFADTATGGLFLSDNERVQRFNDGLNELAPAVKTVLGDFFSDDPDRLDKALAELDLPAGGELTPRQKIDLLKAHPNVAVRTAAAALDLIIIQPGTQIGEGIGIAIAQSQREEADSLEEEVFRFRLEREEKIEINEGIIEGAFLALDLGVGKAAIVASKNAIKVGKKVFGSVDDAIAEINVVRKAKGLGPLDEAGEASLRGAKEVAERADAIAETKRIEEVLKQRAAELAENAKNAKVNDVIVDGVNSNGALSDNAQSLIDDIIKRAEAQADELLAKAEEADLLAKQQEEAAEAARRQAEEAANKADEPPPEQPKVDQEEPEIVRDEPEPEPQPQPQPDAEDLAKQAEAEEAAQRQAELAEADRLKQEEAALKQAEADAEFEKLFGDNRQPSEPRQGQPQPDANAQKQAEADAEFEKLFGDNNQSPDPNANQVDVDSPVDNVDDAKNVLDDAIEDVDDAIDEVQRASQEAARKLQEELAKQIDSNPLPKAKVDETIVELDADAIQRLQDDPASLFGKGSEGEVLKLAQGDGTVDALKLLNQFQDATGAFDPVAAQKAADDAIATARKLEQAGANLAPIKGQGKVKAKTPDGGEADVPFLIVDAFPPGTQELSKLLIPDPNDANKAVLSKLTREQQIELLRQFDLAVKEGLVLIDSNPGNLLLNGTPGKVTASFGETGGFFDALDPNTARAVQAERLFGSQVDNVNLVQAQLKANRVARETGAPKIDLSLVVEEVPRGGQGLLDQFDSELIEAFKDPEAFKKLLDEFDSETKPKLAADDVDRIKELQKVASEADDAVDDALETRDALANLRERLENPDIPVEAAPVDIIEVSTRLTQVNGAIDTTRQSVLDAATKQFDQNKVAAELADKAEEATAKVQNIVDQAAADAAKADALQAEVSNAVQDLLSQPKSPAPPGGQLNDQVLQVNSNQITEVVSRPPVGRGQTANVFDANPSNPGQQVVKFFDKSGFEINNAGEVVRNAQTGAPGGNFDAAAALATRDDQIAGAVELANAKVNFLDVTGQGTTELVLANGQLAEVPFLTQRFLPPTAQVLDGVKARLGDVELPRAQQLAILEQLDLAAREGLVLGDANSGNIFLDTVDGRATAGLIETGNVLNIGDPEKARRFIANVLLGDKPGSVIEAAFRQTEAFKAIGLDPGTINQFNAFGGVGTLSSLISPELKAAFKNKDLLQAAFRNGNDQAVAELAAKADEAVELANNSAKELFDNGEEIAVARTAAEEARQAQAALEELQAAVARQTEELDRLKTEQTSLNETAAKLIKQSDDALVNRLAQDPDALDPNSFQAKNIKGFGQKPPPEAPGAGAGQ